MKNSDKPICGVETKQTGEPCERVAGWGTDTEEGPCKFHGGASTGPKTEEGKQKASRNSTKHGLYALPENLKAHFTETQQDRYTAYFEALCTRYEQRHGEEPDAFIKDRLSRVAIECVKERIADDYLARKAKDGNVLVEDQENLTEQGVFMEEASNKILSELTALKRETRLTLKDFGLLNDPDTQKAEATEAALAEILSESE